MLTENSATTPRGVRSTIGFWAVAFAFAVAMAFTTVPAPLWSTYARRDHFSSFTITIAFAIYAAAVAASLFLAGHLSDWYGRRRVLAPAVAMNLVAAVVFVTWPALPGLLLARAVSGLGIGAVTATATAWLAELHAGRAGSRDEGSHVVATVANLGGLALGGLVSGAVAQWLGDRLTLPYLVLAGALGLAEWGLLTARETRVALSSPAHFRPPRRISVPRSSRGRFFAAATAAATAFSVFGLATSLAPTFLAGTLHDGSLALAGFVSFAMFASAAFAQTLGPARTSSQLRAAPPALLGGLGLLTAAVWVPSGSLALFLAGDVLAGVGAGLMFKGAIGTVSELADEAHRAGTLAALFLAAYLGLAGPVIGLGALTQIVSARLSMLAFAAVLAVGIIGATPTLFGRRVRRVTAQPQPIS